MAEEQVILSEQFLQHEVANPLSGHDTGEGDQRVRYEGGLPVFETQLERIEREQAEAKNRDKLYRDQQLKINWQQLKVNTRLMIFTFLLVLTSMAAGGISLFQAHISKISADAAKKSAEAAESAAKTADSTLRHITENDKTTGMTALSLFKEEQRAYVSYSNAMMSTPPICGFPGIVGTRICVDIHFVNTGKTPAVGILITRLATFGENAENTIQQFRSPKPPPPNGDLLGNVGDKWITAATAPVDTYTSKALVDAVISVYVYGVVQYYDIFGDYHETGFCIRRVPGSTSFAGCEYGNWFDTRPPYKNPKK